MIDKSDCEGFMVYHWMEEQRTSLVGVAEYHVMKARRSNQTYETKFATLEKLKAPL